MTWGFVAAAAFTVVSGTVQANKANKAKAAQRNTDLQNEVLALDANVAENKAIAEANLTNTIRTGYKVGLLNVQKAQAKKLAMQQGFDLSRSAQQLLGSNAANAAANGTVGSSVDAVVQDIDMRVSEAQVQMGADYEVQSDNFETQLLDLLNQGRDVLRAPSQLNVQRPAEQNYIGFGEVLGNAALQIGSQYVGQKMSLGLGSSSAGSAPMRTFNVSPGVAPAPASSVTSIMQFSGG